jgi:hypothetical protein
MTLAMRRRRLSRRFALLEYIETGMAMKTRLLAFAVCAGLTSQPMLAANSLYKQRGPLDKFRQFTSHFEFATPRLITDVRSCVLDAIKQAALEGKAPEPVFTMKASNKGGVSVEKYTWKLKSNGYTSKHEASFRFSDSWTHVDVDPVFGYKYEANGFAAEPGTVALHEKCGLASTTVGFENDIPRVLAHSAGDEDVVYSAISPASIGKSVGCLSAFSEDEGSHYLGSTLEADHLGNFYVYYVQQYKNLGSTVRTHYAARIKAEGDGARIDILMPGISTDNFNPDEAERSLFPLKRALKCGATKQLKST